MRLEILSGSENPVYYPINKQKMVLGSDLTCDIVVSENEISRKHLILIQEGDSFYVIDQGSTNGSYLNEERLIPGRRVEFTSYFPVRLGSSVLISLIGDEDSKENEKISIPFPSAESSKPKPNPIQSAPKQRDVTRTTVISLKDLQGSSTKELVKKRDTIKKKTAKELAKKSKKKKFSFQLTHFISLAIIGGAIYFTLNKKKEEHVESLQVDQTTGKVKEAVPAVPAKPALPTPPRLITTIEIFETKPKCATEEEKILCSSIPLARELPWGVSIIDKDIFIMVNVEKYWLMALSRLPPKRNPSQPKPNPDVSQTPSPSDASQSPAAVDSSSEIAEQKDPFEGMTPEEKSAYEKELWEITIGFFLGDGLPTTEYQQFTGKTFNFAFFLLQEGLPALRATIAITPESLTEARRLATPERFAYIKESRAQVMNFREYLYNINI